MRLVDSVRFTEITLRRGTTSVTVGTCGMWGLTAAWGQKWDMFETSGSLFV